MITISINRGLYGTVIEVSRRSVYLRIPYIGEFACNECLRRERDIPWCFVPWKEILLLAVARQR